MSYVFASSIGGFIQTTLSGMGILAGLVATFLLVWSGLRYITSSGNVNKMEAAKRSIIRSFIGLIIVISAIALSLVIKHAYGPVTIHANQHLPSLKGIKAVNSSGGLVSILLQAISGLLVAIIRSASKPFIDALQYFTKSTPLLVHNGSVLHLWLVSTGIADALLALVIGLLGFNVMGAEYFGFHDIDLKSLLPQVIMIFLLLNTSIYILDGFIELSNVMISAIRSGTGGVTPWNSLISIVTNVGSYSLAALFIYLVFLVLSVILLVYYIGRIVVLYVGAVLAPLVLLLWLVPMFRDFAENAFKTYIATIFVLFIHVIILALAGSLFSSVAVINGTKDPIMTLLLGMATLISLIKTQGVLMQLNYASLGPKAVRRIGGSFINGVGHLTGAAKYAFSDIVPPAAVLADSIKSYVPAGKPKKSAASKTNKADTK